jgi:ribonuclease HII
MLQLQHTPGLLEAGCDEAGRGCLAGPVVAASVILPADFQNELLNDSKKLTEKQRFELRKIIEKEAVSWAVSYVNNREIDDINILQASFTAMHRAVDALHIQPKHLLIDGNRFRPKDGYKHTCFIKGDGKFMAIAAASILAKTYRDDFMEQIHEEYPQYNWKKNKGYPTADHRKSIAKFGETPFHRMTFNLLGNGQLSLFEE